MEKQAQRSFVPPQGPFPTATQRELGPEAMKMLGFDFNGGRLDVSAHPFCGGVPEDVRITTRYDEGELLSALFGVIHETGHARYEQNLPRAWAGQPVALARSTAIHESQSLFFEMQLGRSDAFLKHLLPAVHARFGSRAAFSEENFIARNQRVKPGYIRVDADEVSYPAHVVLRYEIERALINGEIEVDDIPALWDEKMQARLGLSTKDNYRNGCMQDIHWTDGGFGYFPSYTLGQCMRHSCSMPPKLRCPGCRHPLPGAISQHCLTGCVRISGSTAAVSAHRSSSPGHGRRPEYPLLPRTPDVPLSVTERAGVHPGVVHTVTRRYQSLTETPNLQGYSYFNGPAVGLNENQIRGYENEKVLALVVAAAMGLSSAAFAAETTATAAPAASTAAPAKTVHHKNITKRLNQRQNRKRRPLKAPQKRQNQR